MALDNITLADGQGTPANHVFEFTTQNNGRVIRSDFSRSPEEPLTLSLAHQSKSVNKVKVSSHLMRVDCSVLDADGVTVHTANIRVMADVPAPIHSDALAADLAAYIRNWATAETIAAWLKGSVG